MHNPDQESIIKQLHLAPNEERILRGIVSPELPGRNKNFFNRPLQGSKGVIIAAVSLLVIGACIVLLWPVASKLRWLGDSERLDALVTIVMFLGVYIMGRRISLLEQLVTKLYNLLEQKELGKSGESSSR